MLTGAFCMLGAGAAAYFAYESFQSFIAETNSIHARVSTEGVTVSEGTSYLLWLLGIRSVLLTGVSVAFVAYLMVFMRRNYDEDVTYHRDLQRYSMDINRASWVIETAMEMTGKENAQLPERWIEGATANLFDGGAKNAGVNSLSALGAILGLGPEIDAGPDGIRLKLAKSASKAAAKGAD